jgi:hypothetical protein
VRRTACLKTLARGTEPHRRATHPTDGPTQGDAQPCASDLTPPARLALAVRELDNLRMSYASGRSRAVNLCERGRTEQTDDERQWEDALAGEIHDG